MNKKRKSTKKAKFYSPFDHWDDEDPLAGDLSEFIKDASEKGLWKIGRFEIQEKKDKVISLRISDKLLKEIKAQAALLGLDTQKFIRLSLENVVRKRTG